MYEQTYIGYIGYGMMVTHRFYKEWKINLSEYESFYRLLFLTQFLIGQWFCFECKFLDVV